MANKDFQNGLIIGLAAGSTPVTVTTDWGDTITDDWDTIIANANAGTVSGYSIGDTKTIEFVYDGMPLAIQCMIVDKSHETISGTANKAALTFMFKHKEIFEQMMTSNVNTGGWLGENGVDYADTLNETDGELVYGCVARKTLWKLYKAFPSNLQTAIKTVDKKYDDDNGVRTCKDKLFLPSTQEVGATATIATDLGETAYAAFSDNASRIINGIGASYYWLRQRRNNQTTSFCSIIANTGAHSSSSASAYYAMRGTFCL